MHPEASDDTQAHTLRPHVPALSAPVDLAQVPAAARRGPAVCGPGAPGPRGPRLRSPGGVGGPCARDGTASAAGAGDGVALAPGGEQPPGGSGVRRITNGTGTPHALYQDHAPTSPSGNHVTVGGVCGRTLCRIRNLIWMPSF